MNASEKKAIAGLGGIFALRMLGLFMIVPVFAVYGTQYATRHAVFDWIGDWYLWLRAGDFFRFPWVLADKYPVNRLSLQGYWCLRLGSDLRLINRYFIWWYWGVWLQAVARFQRVVMALLADVTREEHRTKAMATMGLTICHVGDGRIWARSDFDACARYFRLVLGDSGVRYFRHWLTVDRAHPKSGT